MRDINNEEYEFICKLVFGVVPIDKQSAKQNHVFIKRKNELIEVYGDDFIHTYPIFNAKLSEYKNTLLRRIGASNISYFTNNVLQSLELLAEKYGIDYMKIAKEIGLPEKVRLYGRH